MGGFIWNTLFRVSKPLTPVPKCTYFVNNTHSVVVDSVVLVDTDIVVVAVAVELADMCIVAVVVAAELADMHIVFVVVAAERAGTYIVVAAVAAEPAGKHIAFVVAFVGLADKRIVVEVERRLVHNSLAAFERVHNWLVSVGQAYKRIGFVAFVEVDRDWHSWSEEGRLDQLFSKKCFSAIFSSLIY